MEFHDNRFAEFEAVFNEHLAHTKESLTRLADMLRQLMDKDVEGERDSHDASGHEADGSSD